jgi:fumarate reductase (CoM/CoB) subunit A
VFSRMDDIQRVTTDVLVIGSGGAGCRAALAAHDSGAKVIVASASGVTGKTSTFYNLTCCLGYAFGANEREVEVHYRNILEVGQGMADPRLAEILAEEAPLRLQELLQWGFPFEMKESHLKRIRPDFEPSSSEVSVGATRIDSRQMRYAFRRLLRVRGIEELPYHLLISLLQPDHCRTTGDNPCEGALFLNRKGQPVIVQAKATVLATGGPNNVFLRHKNPSGLEGVGQVAALALGAELINIEFYQVCFLMAGPIAGMNFSPNFLKAIPKLTNGLGEEFLAGYLPDGVGSEQCIRQRAQNAPFHSQGIAKYFDIAVISEINAGRGSPGGGVWFDFTSIPREELRNKDPRNFDWLASSGVDLSRQPVEVLVAPHAFNGGIWINERAETRVPGLFAAGEVAGGPHGANRIGGNSIAGTQVFGARAGHFAAERAKQVMSVPDVDVDRVRQELARIQQYLDNQTRTEPRAVQRAMQQVMWEEMVVFKDAPSLEHLLRTLDAIQGDLLPGMAIHTLLSAQLEISKIIACVAQVRQESRGPHYRTDHPDSNDELFGKTIVVSQAQGGYRLSAISL